MRDLAAEVTELKERLARVEATLRQRTPAGPATLPDVDLDSEHGDPEIRRDPPKWEGRSYVGARMSQCPPDYLRSLSGFLQWKSRKNDEEGKGKYAKYDLLDAARAIGWAKRNESSTSGAAEASRRRRYGTTGFGASAKHTGTPEPGDVDDVEADFGHDDTGIPF